MHIMQKTMEGHKPSDSVFSQWDVMSSLVKLMKTRQIKAAVSQSCSNTMSHPGWHHVEEHAQGFPKMCNFGW